MANTVNRPKFHTIQVSDLDSDWDLGAEERISSIVFHPGAASDEAVFKDGDDTGPRIAPFISQEGEDVLWYGRGVKKQVYFDFSDSTITAGAYFTVNLGAK